LETLDTLIVSKSIRVSFRLMILDEKAAANTREFSVALRLLISVINTGAIGDIQVDR